MSVKFEIKGMLAKLLSTEDLIVEHKKVSTACFNVHTRVLTLPMWEKASDNIYTMLVLHEISHALFTPDDDWTEIVKVPQQFVNICEDVRVEKLCKRKYPGSPKTFFAGYKELNEQDFFMLEGQDVSTFNLADRANLYFKIGNFIDLSFNPEEKEIIDMIADIETFEDTLHAAEVLYKYCKKEKEQEKVSDLEDNQKETGVSSGEEQEQEQESQSEESEQQESEEKTPEGQQSEESGSNEETSETPQTVENSEKNEEPEVRTVDALDEKIKDLVSNDGYENNYIEIPKLNLETVIAKNSEIHQVIDEYFSEQQIKFNNAQKLLGKETRNIYIDVNIEFKKFKVSAQKEVNYLVKEFECRKAADAYARTSTARTGTLDTARLHTYMFNDDLFKKVSVIADGKNHGLIFILDWSGSMSSILMDTLKQLFNLMWFCKKVSIPFEVYAFTNEWNYPNYNDGKIPPYHYEKKDGLLSVESNFSLMNFFTSKVTNQKLEHQMENIWRVANYMANPYGMKYSCPSRVNLSGTPLNESLIALHQILPQFQKENKLQKVQCVILTDGEASQLPYHVEINRSRLDTVKETYIGIRAVNAKSTFLRDRKIGTTYKFEYGYHQYTDTLLRNLKDKFPTVNFIGIRVINGRDAGRFINLYHNHGDKEYFKIMSDWKKMKSFTITKSGYDAYFGLSSSALSQDTDFDVHVTATKAQIKSAFAKSLKSKKMNKKVLGEFIELVA
jgi:hypothetical protein